MNIYICFQIAHHWLVQDDYKHEFWNQRPWVYIRIDCQDTLALHLKGVIGQTNYEVWKYTYKVQSLTSKTNVKERYCQNNLFLCNKIVKAVFLQFDLNIPISSWFIMGFKFKFIQAHFQINEYSCWADLSLLSFRDQVSCIWNCVSKFTKISVVFSVGNFFPKIIIGIRALNDMAS